MASGKLSPRQKMINMMYLVLTAILALNVSSEILQAFESLRRSLSESSSHMSTTNAALSGAILLTVDRQVKAGESSKEKFRAYVEEIGKETGALTQYLTTISGELEGFADKDPKTGELKKKDEQDRNYRYWLGSDDVANSGRGNGKAKELREKLEAYVKWANGISAKIDPANKDALFQSFTVDPIDDPGITDKDSKSKKWEYHTFHGKPVIADMAMVEKFRMDVNTMETALLNMVKNQLNDNVIPMDTLYAMDALVSTVVAAGMPFETKLFVTAGSKEVKPEFMGQGVTVDPDGNTATMKIFANGNVIPEGKSEGTQSYTSIIKIRKRNGEIMELPLKREFTVRKPEVVVRSKSVQVLYKDCANTVTVDVPALGEFYNPDFSKSTGGSYVVSAANKREVTLVPTAQKFKLAVYSNTNGQSLKIDNVEYDVIKPPKPTLQLSVNGRPYEGRGDVPRREKLTITLKPDVEFAERMKADAKYKTSKVKLLLKDTMLAPTTLDTKSGNIMSGITFNLGEYPALRSAPAGARIYVEVEEVKRVNFQGKEVGTELDIYARTLSATIK